MNGFLFQYGDQVFNESGLMADNSFFQVFSFPLTMGNRETVLARLENIAISQKLAEKYFPDSNPLGKVFKINNQDFAVSGVFENVPQNSHLQFDFVLPFELYIKFGWDSLKTWGNNSYYTYVQLSPQSSFEAANEKVKGIIKENNPNSVTELYLQPLADIHLHSHFTADIPGHGDIQYVYIFSAIAVFVLLIACINFMNLSTARSAGRSKEVGVRKVIGAARSQLIRQFLTESLTFAVLGLAVAIGIALALLPAFNELSGKPLNLTLGASDLWIFIALVALVTGLISGSYPALFMSSFKPVSTLKGTFRTGRGALVFRKVLVVLQFSISILLISGTIIVYTQLNFIRNKKLGFEKANTMLFRFNDDIRTNRDAFKNELLQQAGVRAVSYLSQNLTYVGNSTSGLEWEGKDPDSEILVHFMAVDYDFIPSFNVEMVSGRNFSHDMITDSSAIILNETAVQQMGLSDPLNKKITWGGTELTVVGVVKDFHFKSIHNAIEPLLLAVVPTWLNRVYVKIEPGRITDGVAAVERVFKKFSPDRPFEFSFLDDEFDRLYRAEQRTGNIFEYFAIIAVVISCLGLFGLVMFTTEQRTREIGIRKVLGASVSSLFALISVDFVGLVIAANVIAIPAAWYIMDLWLSGFAYHIDIRWVTFVIAGIVSVAVAWATMSYQSIRAATANPVNSLRIE